MLGCLERILGGDLYKKKPSVAFQGDILKVILRKSSFEIIEKSIHTISEEIPLQYYWKN